MIHRLFVCISGNGHLQASGQQNLAVKNVNITLKGNVSLSLSPAGVADQLQTNFASDMRTILKSVFEVTASSADPRVDSAEIDCECACLVFKAVSKSNALLSCN